MAYSLTSLSKKIKHIMPKKPLVLLILDGWGYSLNKAHNAIAAAHTPQWDSWWASCPHWLLDASSHAVGLPDDQMGNSEVGHMHIGAGRLIPQDLTRINQALSDGSFATNPDLLQTIHALKRSKKTLHVVGLLSNGGVHSHQDHLFAFLALCDQHHFDNIALHLILDGRDTPPQSALANLSALNQQLVQHPVAQICSISGRYYAMDRDKRWERIEPVYRLLTEGISDDYANSANEALHSFYAQKVHDEFVPPTRIGTCCPMNDGDGLFLFNFRADRSRQITDAFLNPDFKGFARSRRVTLSTFMSMTQVSATLKTRCVFPPMTLNDTVGEVIANNQLTQLRLAETEKYAHVTFFFNGGSENTFPHETRLLIPSPHVATYDLQPEMSAPLVTRSLIEAIESRRYDVIICNYANADMVGHTGNFLATVSAIEHLDRAMQTVYKSIAAQNGHLIITADHGNAECMFDETTQQAHTAHTTHQVPLLYVGPTVMTSTTQSASLIDIAPSMLHLLNITPPSCMTGRNLFCNQTKKT